MKQLEAFELPLAKVFSSDFEFHIPDYQRPYAWGAEQVEALLEDLVDAMERGSDEPYFLGSIVLVKDQAETRVDVIDGQQRLTTLTILLAVLRDLSDNDELRRDLEEMLRERGSLVQGLEARPRLSLRSRDRGFFAAYVQQACLDQLALVKDDALETDAQRAIRDNAGLIRSRLAKMSAEERFALVSMLGRRTFLVMVTTPTLESAHWIFSVLNARGLDLTPADLFKSTVIGALGHGGVSEAYAAKWEDAEEELGRQDFADVFLHVRMIFAKERAKRELLKEFDDQVLSAYIPARAKEFVDDVLVPYAQAYGTTRDADYSSQSGADGVNLWLRRLGQLDNNDWRPPVMWALREHGDDPGWMTIFLARVERLAASMFIRRVYATPRATRYAQLLTELADGAGCDALALELSGDEKRETVERLSGEVYQSAKSRRFILLRLDQEVADDAGATYHPTLVTVEHVLPQNPAPSSTWMATFTEEDRLFWTHGLANLVLLNRSKNSEAGNLDFGPKKAKYFTSGKGVVSFALTSQVLALPEWTPAVLEKRQDELLKVLTKAWGL